MFSTDVSDKQIKVHVIVEISMNHYLIPWLPLSYSQKTTISKLFVEKMTGCTRFLTFENSDQGHILGKLVNRYCQNIIVYYITDKEFRMVNILRWVELCWCFL